MKRYKITFEMDTDEFPNDCDLEVSLEKLFPNWKHIDVRIKDLKQGELCPFCRHLSGTNNMCSDCARFRKDKELLNKSQSSASEREK